jgi:hypothetical protein
MRFTRSCQQFASQQAKFQSKQRPETHLFVEAPADGEPKEIANSHAFTRSQNALDERTECSNARGIRPGSGHQMPFATENDHAKLNQPMVTGVNIIFDSFDTLRYHEYGETGLSG